MSDEPVRTLIHELEKQRYAAMVDGDLATLDRLLSPRLSYTHSNGDRDTKDSYLQKVRDGVFVYLGIDHRTERVEILGDAVVVIGWMRLRAKREGVPVEIGSNVLAVWGRTDGEWTLVAYQPTPLREHAPH